MYKIDYSKPGSDEYIRGFANLLASWGVDFIKMDFVGPGGGNQPADTRDDLRHWSAALESDKATDLAGTLQQPEDRVHRRLESRPATAGASAMIWKPITRRS